MLRSLASPSLRLSPCLSRHMSATGAKHKKALEAAEEASEGSSSSVRRQPLPPKATEFNQARKAYREEAGRLRKEYRAAFLERAAAEAAAKKKAQEEIRRQKMLRLAAKREQAIENTRLHVERLREAREKKAARIEVNVRRVAEKEALQNVARERAVAELNRASEGWLIGEADVARITDDVFEGAGKAVGEEDYPHRGDWGSVAYQPNPVRRRYTDAWNELAMMEAGVPCPDPDRPEGEADRPGERSNIQIAVDARRARGEFVEKATASLFEAMGGPAIPDEGARRLALLRLRARVEAAELFPEQGALIEGTDEYFRSAKYREDRAES
ncbi:hypothetical protein TeGR_g14598 [Tetraparma gracilis]|uniref:Uncharacterized protein n=1 Tax=Tetraparma gracilis TaxID=2962635 RepID=A0ABQ6N3I2_9STRA|nr:hypothetical protein TeGR_g14598 [Tetraparma gracilis]